MVSSKVFAPLFAIVLATVANASPAAFPEAYPSPEIVKRDCAQTYTVVSGDVCSAIESRFGVSDAQLHALNPAINAGCTNLQIGQVLCVSGASYYNPAGGFGACGTVLQDSDFIVALGTDHWDGGSHCGQTMRVQRNGGSISVIVADLCPGCVGLHGANSIDLSQGAMAALDSNFINDGITTVQWTL
ncbi:RlpA-like double-psi beta-barrel-protein domain-containing protein-containing protein [Mycena olivaceomarginata]|nr:RlpA-like double-psi beta-barrel-protein domain-containing protein-containing protein [Mycena olivaceomarginata]